MTSARVREIADFLGAHRPFDQLPTSVVESVADELESARFASGTALVDPGSRVAHLYVIRRGRVEVCDSSGTTLARLGEGDLLGQDDLLSETPSGIGARALEDTIAYRLPAPRVKALCTEHPAFQLPASVPPADAAVPEAERALPSGPSVALMNTPVSQIVTRAPVEVTPGTSIRECAQLMSREGISSLLVIDDGALAGIVTDRDLRSRVVAEGRSVEGPISAVMSASPVTIDASRQAHEALLAMARSHFHHLPVVDGDRLIGMITDTDLLQRHSTSPLFVIGDVHRCEDVEELAAASSCLHRLLTALVDANASCESTGRVLSSVGEAITSRLLALAERRLGPPPVPYAFLAGGSLARFEQSVRSDQDNCLLLDDAFDAATHGAYFEALATQVCDGLDACGYVYCPGEIMAKTPRWRQPLAVWKRYFDGWIDEPEPKALMHASIFFDLRMLHGDPELFGELQTYVLDKARRNHIFHVFMTSNALTHEPPIGFFGNFVLVKDGEHDRTLDLKHSGIIPIVDIARVYALAGGIGDVNTRERLDAAEKIGLLSDSGAADLRDALEFIGTVRLRHQARQIRDGATPDNFVPPADLSHFERNQLKDAFAVVRTIRSALSQRYQAARLL